MNDVKQEELERQILTKYMEIHGLKIELLNHEIAHLKVCVQVFAILCVLLLVSHCVFILVWALS